MTEAAIVDHLLDRDRAQPQHVQKDAVKTHEACWSLVVFFDFDHVKALDYKFMQQCCSLHHSWLVQCHLVCWRSSALDDLCCSSRPCDCYGCDLLLQGLAPPARPIWNSCFASAHIQHINVPHNDQAASSNTAYNQEQGFLPETPPAGTSYRQFATSDSLTQLRWELKTKRPENIALCSVLGDRS